MNTYPRKFCRAPPTSVAASASALARKAMSLRAGPHWRPGSLLPARREIASPQNGPQ